MKYLYMLIFVSSLSHAGGDKVDIPDYMQVHKPYLALTCIDAQNQQDMDACGKQSLARSTEQMNRLLGILKNNHSNSEPDLLKALKDSQEAWKPYMESSCRVETYYSRDGTGFNSIWNACLEAKTNERISFLSWMLDNP